MPRIYHTALLVCLVLASLSGGNRALAASKSASVSPSRSQLKIVGVEPRLTCDELARPDNALEAGLLEDAADGRLDRHTLLSATLIAGGADVHVVRSAERRVRNWAAELNRDLDPHGSDRDRARAILAFLHQRICTGSYELTCSDVRLALDEGRYNCVNSTILFNALAEQLGLRTVAIECPAHVFSVVLTATGEIDVETTCPEWFDLEHRPHQRQAALSAKTGEQTAGQRWEGPRRRIDAAGLTALVYYNRGVDLLEQQSFAGAVAANAKALRLDPRNAQARGNLLAALNNWALDSAAAGEHELAIRILDSGLELAPSHDLFHTNYLAIHQQWFHKLNASGRHVAVLDLVRHASQRLPDQAYWQQAAATAQRGLTKSQELRN